MLLKSSVILTDSRTTLSLRLPVWKVERIAPNSQGPEDGPRWHTGSMLALPGLPPPVHVANLDLSSPLLTLFTSVQAG